MSGNARRGTHINSANDGSSPPKQQAIISINVDWAPIHTHTHTNIYTYIYLNKAQWNLYVLSKRTPLKLLKYPLADSVTLVQGVQSYSIHRKRLPHTTTSSLVICTHHFVLLVLVWFHYKILVTHIIQRLHRPSASEVAVKETGEIHIF